MTSNSFYIRHKINSSRFSGLIVSVSVTPEFISKTARNNKCSLLLYNFVRTKKSLQLKKGTFFLCRQYWTKCWINTKIMTNIVKEVIVQDVFLQKET